MKQKGILKIVYASIIIASITFAGLFAVMQGFSSTESTESVEGLSALNSYLTITGETQGQILGSVTQTGREDSIRISQVSQTFQYGTKGTIHTPLYMTKQIEQSSPLLFFAMDTHELLQVRLEFWRQSPTGVEEQFYTIELIDAYIVSIHFYMKDNLNPDLATYPEMEEISFVYSIIKFTYVDGGIVAEGDWPGTTV